MADPNLGQVTASLWEQVIGTKPTDNIFNSRALFYALGESGFKEQADGGRLIEFSLEYATNTTFKSYGELDPLDTTRIDVFDAARYDWKVNAGTVVWSDLEQLRASAASRKFDVVAEKLENGKDSHIAAMNVQMWGDGTGNGGKDIGGLKLIIAAAPTVGTVGGINRANFSFWRNQQNVGTNGGTAFDTLRARMRTTYNQCTLGGVTNAPTAAITNRVVFEGYEGLLTTNERYNKDGTRPRGADLSWANDALQFKGADVFYDEDCTATGGLGDVYFVNPKFLKLVYLKGGWMKMKDVIEPSNQLGFIQRIFTVANLATNGSKYLGIVNAVT